MLSINAGNNHITAFFEQLIGVDEVKKYKPDPAYYALGVNKLHLFKEEILFVPFA